MNSYSDPITRPEVQVRRDAHQTEIKAANKALGRSGSHREWAFRKILIFEPAGLTAIDLAYMWAEANPCFCGCDHRLPIPVNQWGTRLGELRDAGLIRYVIDESGEPHTRSRRGRSGNIHVATLSGRRVATERGMQ